MNPINSCTYDFNRSATKREPAVVSVPKLSLPSLDEVSVPRLQAGQTGYVYIIGNETGEYVKIGWSTTIRQRFTTLQSYIPTPLKVYALIPAVPALERGLHDRFAEHRATGEWFRLEGDLAEWIAGKRPKHVSGRRLEVLRQREAALEAVRLLDARP